jgi:hypothetical protein
MSRWKRKSSPPPPSWTRKRPTKPGWYWYRDADREEVVLHVFDPQGNGVMKVWEWSEGHMLRPIAEYDGEWWGPMTPPQ